MPLRIYSYGVKFSNKFDIEGVGITIKALEGVRPQNVGKLTGKDDVVQKSILKAKNSEMYFKKLADRVKLEDATYVAFYCQRGHHRSVACAEIFRKLHFTDAIVTHLNLPE